MRIGRRVIGPKSPPLVIAELGLSDEGDVETALGHITEAYRRGAECVKQQIHVPLSSEMQPGHPWWKTLERCALSVGELRRCKMHAEALGMIWLCTPFSVEGVEALERMDVPAYKVGSGEITHVPMLEAIARTGKPVILSTGMADAKKHEEWSASQLFGGWHDGGRLMRLSCMSGYPTPLSAVRDIDARDGWSDHTGGIAASLAAVALGARIIEIHVPRRGPDAAASVDWDEFEVLVTQAPLIWEACCPPTVDVPDEEPTRLAKRRESNGYRRAG